MDEDDRRSGADRFDVELDPVGCGNFRHWALYYNFVRIHKTLRTTPAMAAKVTKRLWEIGDIVDVLEAWENTT
jgi:hypothetical protein